MKSSGSTREPESCSASPPKVGRSARVCRCSPTAHTRAVPTRRPRRPDLDPPRPSHQPGHPRRRRGRLQPGRTQPAGTPGQTPRAAVRPHSQMGHVRQGWPVERTGSPSTRTALRQAQRAARRRTPAPAPRTHPCQLSEIDYVKRLSNVQQHRQARRLQPAGLHHLDPLRRTTDQASQHRTRRTGTLTMTLDPLAHRNPTIKRSHVVTFLAM